MNNRLVSLTFIIKSFETNQAPNHQFALVELEHSASAGHTRLMRVVEAYKAAKVVMGPEI
jgi:hypothetical protein